MVNGTELEIGRVPVFAPEFEIIKALPLVERKELSLTLQKVDAPVVIPPPVTPLPIPEILPSPIPFAPIVPVTPGKLPLIINIETTGYKPWKHRIIAIGFQDPSRPGELPNVLIDEDEGMMLKILFAIIKDVGYNQVIGYGYSFDLRFVTLRAMKLGITCKEFVDMDIYDLGQAMAQVKMQFVYFAQKQPSLSDISEFFWGYPKPFTDLEMIKYYAQGRLDKVREFASSQVTRILLLYSLFRNITETSFIGAGPGLGSATFSVNPPPTGLTESKLTIPEAHAPETWTAKCPICMQEAEVPINLSEYACQICGKIIKKI